MHSKCSIENRIHFLIVRFLALEAICGMEECLKLVPTYFQVEDTNGSELQRRVCTNQAYYSDLRDPLH